MERDPNAYAGNRYVLHGYVTQFDSNTGPDSFRSNTSGEYKRNWWDYDINTMVSGDPAILANVVTDDRVKMYVEVDSAYSYSTTMGGEMTVPLVTVNIIEVTGSTG